MEHEKTAIHILSHSNEGTPEKIQTDTKRGVYSSDKKDQSGDYLYIPDARKSYYSSRGGPHSDYKREYLSEYGERMTLGDNSSQLGNILCNR